MYLELDMGRDREAVVHEVVVPTAERPNQSLKRTRAAPAMRTSACFSSSQRDV